MFYFIITYLILIETDVWMSAMLFEHFFSYLSEFRNVSISVRMSRAKFMTKPARRLQPASTRKSNKS